MLDKFFAYLVKLVQHAPAQVDAQNVSNSLLYCYKLRYMPQPAQAAALLAHFVSLFSGLGREPSAQGMSNTVVAVAGLGVPYVEHEVQSIASRVVSSPDANSQNLCNLAWSMALLDILDQTGFDLILDMLKVRTNNGVGRKGVSQLHQAHCHLEPLSKNSEEYAAWVVVKDKLEKSVGPAPKAEIHPGSDALLSLVEELGLRHRHHVQLSAYVPAAVLKRTDDPERAAVLLLAESERAYLVNHPDRLKGSAMSRHRLLARHGQVVAIPYHKLSVEGVKAELEAAIGVPLHRAFKICTSQSLDEALNRQPQQEAEDSQGSSRTRGGTKKLSQQKAVRVAQPA